VRERSVDSVDRIAVGRADQPKPASEISGWLFMIQAMPSGFVLTLGHRRIAPVLLTLGNRRLHDKTVPDHSDPSRLPSIRPNGAGRASVFTARKIIAIACLRGWQTRIRRSAQNRKAVLSTSHEAVACGIKVVLVGDKFRLRRRGAAPSERPVWDDMNTRFTASTYASSNSASWYALPEYKPACGSGSPLDRNGIER
jgi:hypothetical protein